MSAARAAILGLLEERRPGATICPSEAARRLNREHWRGEMERVHAAVDALLANGEIALSWKGKRLEGRQGPYRIERRPA